MTRIQDIEARLSEIRKEQETLGKEWTRLMGRNLTKRMKVLFPKGEITIDRVMQVDWEELGNRGYGNAWWKRINDWLNDQSYGVYDEATCQNTGERPLHGLMFQGVVPETKQIGVRVVMRQWEAIEEQMGLLRILPFTKPREGWKVFSIFEASLSQCNSYLVRVSEDHKTVEVWESRGLRDGVPKYSHSEPMHRSEGRKAVEKALAFIWECLPYERKRDEDDRDSYDDDDSW
jgi:hypothetical protein